MMADHHSVVQVEGKQPGLLHLLKLGEVCGIEKSHALTVIDHVREAVSCWPQFAATANVTKKSGSLIQSALNRVNK